MGFTLIEILTATAVLILMFALLTPMFTSLTSSTSRSTGNLETDLIARQAMDRIGRDLAMMPMREDLDYFLTKAIGNDAFDFFTRVPGALPVGTDADANPSSGLSLVGYRVADGNLERMAVAQPFNSLAFLTYDVDDAIVSSTGITHAIVTTTDTNYHILGKGIFRFELGFLLKDGTYQTLPMDTGANPPADTQPGFRRWTTSTTHNFAEVSLPDGPGRVTFRPLGWQDVAAVVVTLAVIDPASFARITPAELSSTAAQLPDAAASTTPADLRLTGTVWKEILETPGSLGLPQAAQNGIRIYQRAFYLNNP